ncbi:hypothetical protein FUA23_03320 [Neolewinella aurantiaca]|uniref:Uncharacterized protein n=1 Tax=Neolewinella aurantiaca TaxID=2602767 RepID=A0A5C7FT49_9BACT|nr:hypothetical protein [Neolewinella aurantiaca]TXF91267.1 hypothetical protein FUA23_03320 [Neolewinella aurantiaca]
MDLSQFPERFRAKVLSNIVRNSRLGIAIRFGKLKGQVLPLSIHQEVPSPNPLHPSQLEALARTAFHELPYELQIKTGGLQDASGPIEPA